VRDRDDLAIAQKLSHQLVGALRVERRRAVSRDGAPVLASAQALIRAIVEREVVRTDEHVCDDALSRQRAEDAHEVPMVHEVEDHSAPLAKARLQPVQALDGLRGRELWAPVQLVVAVDEVQMPAREPVDLTRAMRRADGPLHVLPHRVARLGTRLPAAFGAQVQQPADDVHRHGTMRGGRGPQPVHQIRRRIKVVVLQGAHRSTGRG
jgi:hypothetical protein